MLTHDDAQRLLREDPRELDRRALEARAEFLFGVQDLRVAKEVVWGGEVRALLNQNVVLHLVPRYNDEMRNLDELPQFVVFPDDARAGEDRTHRYAAVKDLEAFDGVVFYVSAAEYRSLVDELAGAARRYPGYLRIPDALYADGPFERFVRTRVLEHALVRAERSFDFTKHAF